MMGRLLHSPLATVGVDADILVNLIAFAVVYNGSFSGSHHIAEPDLRSGCQNAVEGADSACNSADNQADESSQGQLNQGNAELPGPLFCFRIKSLLSCSDASFSVIHVLTFLPESSRKQYPVSVNL